MPDHLLIPPREFQRYLRTARFKRRLVKSMGISLFELNRELRRDTRSMQRHALSPRAKRILLSLKSDAYLCDERLRIAKEIIEAGDGQEEKALRPFKWPAYPVGQPRPPI